MSTLLFVLVIAAIIPAFAVIHGFFRWVAEGDPQMQSVVAESARDQIERPLYWRN